MAGSPLALLARRCFLWNNYSSRNLYVSGSSFFSSMKQNFDNPFDKESTIYADIDTDDALDHPDYFGVHNLFTVGQLFDARVHYGHKAAGLHDSMRQFVYGIRADQVIFDLDITAYHLRKALNIIAQIALRGGLILLVSRNPQNSFTIEETAKQCGEFAHTRKWLGAEFTDSSKHYGAVTRLPELVIFLSTLSELRTPHRAITDSAKMNIPTVGIVDSNCCPDLITYPIPGNDDSICAVELYCRLFKEAILLGKAERDRRTSILNQTLAEEKAQKSSRQKLST